MFTKMHMLRMMVHWPKHCILVHLQLNLEYSCAKMLKMHGSTCTLSILVNHVGSNDKATAGQPQQPEQEGSTGFLKRSCSDTLKWDCPTTCLRALEHRGRSLGALQELFCCFRDGAQAAAIVLFSLRLLERDRGEFVPGA